MHEELQYDVGNQKQENGNEGKSMKKKRKRNVYNCT